MWVNSYRAFHPTVPFGGFKQRGFGEEYGFVSVAMYPRSKAIVWDLGTDPDLPYRETAVVADSV